MRQTVLRLVCDDCGKIEQFEIASTDPLTFSTDVSGFISRAGWHATKKEGGSNFSPHDRCPACIALVRAKLGMGGAATTGST